jgi:putative peptide zinc metalloprotease protein
MGFLIDDSDEYVFAADKHNEIMVDEPSNRSYSKIGEIIFHKHVIPIYVLIICLNFLFFMFRSDLFPHSRDLFPFQSMVLNILISLMISVLLLVVHESGHVIAARAYGIIPSVRVGHRLFLPVIETQMPTIWRLPRRRRNTPILAGLFMDHTVLCASLFTLTFIPSISAIVSGILGLIILQLVMMSLYQCMFFMKTDLYYLIQNVTGCYNLLESSVGWLKSKLPFIRNQNSTITYEKERNMVRAYAIFYIIGLFSCAIIFIFYVVPQLIYSFSISLERLVNPSSATSKADAIIFFAQFIVYAVLLFYSWRKKFVHPTQ